MSNLAFAQNQPEYTSSALRDPFESQLPLPPVEVEAEGPLKVRAEPVKPLEPPAIKVEGLIFGGPVPEVIIGGKVLAVGDKVEEAVITGITKEGVEVLYQERAFSFPAPSKMMKYSQGGKNDK